MKLTIKRLVFVCFVLAVVLVTAGSLVAQEGVGGIQKGCGNNDGGIVLPDSGGDGTGGIEYDAERVALVAPDGTVVPLSQLVAVNGTVVLWTPALPTSADSSDAAIPPLVVRVSYTSNGTAIEMTFAQSGSESIGDLFKRVAQAKDAAEAIYPPDPPNVGGGGAAGGGGGASAGGESGS